MKTKPLTVGVVLDPIERLRPASDTSLGLLRSAQQRGAALFYMTLSDLYLDGGVPKARVRSLFMKDQDDKPYLLGEKEDQNLDQFDVIWMRKDPPVNSAYQYACHILEMAQLAGVLVLNDPRAIRCLNEKLLATQFPHLMPPTLVSANQAQIAAFVAKHKAAVLKPIGERAGRGIFKTHTTDPNLAVLLETMTQYGKRHIMAQAFVDAVHESGDKRIILVNGKPIPYVLARMPQGQDFRANMAVGGQASGVKLTEREAQICAEVGPVLRKEGLFLVGLDVIGGYLTEINITSPTGIVALEAAFKVAIFDSIWDQVAERLNLVNG